MTWEMMMTLSPVDIINDLDYSKSGTSKTLQSYKVTKLQKYK